MTAPAGPRYAQPGYWSIPRLLAVAATIATILAGFMVVFANLTPQSLENWIATGLIGAGVALACIITL